MATRDGFFITRIGEKWAAIYGIDDRFEVPEEVEEKYLFDTEAEAHEYALGNYTIHGVMLDPDL